MMKLIIAIVQDEDANRLISALMNLGVGVTKLATTGGFLHLGNTTLLTGVQDEQVTTVVEVIKKTGRSRNQIAPIPTVTGVEEGTFNSYPLEVTVGGATVFVLNVEQFIKV